MAELEKELLEKLRVRLNLEEEDIEDITRDSPLFGDKGFELDSVDMLEITYLLESDYGLKVETADRERIFRNFGSLADYIKENKAS